MAIPEIPPHPALEMGDRTPPTLSIWRTPDFFKFWIGQSVSKLGDNFANLALSLLILALTHDPLALGFENAAYLLPYLLLGLPAGAISDRLPRRPLMIVCDVVRMLVYALLALALVTGVLRHDTVWLIYVASAVTAVATIFFDVAYLTAIPAIVAPTQLLAGNSALQFSESTSQLAGPPLAGVVYQALGASIALLGDALSFAVSFGSLLLIRREFRTAAVAGQPQPPRPSLLRSIDEGLRFVWGQPVLRWSMVIIASSNFFGNATFPLILFHMRDQLHFASGLIGVIYGCAAVGGIVGSVIAGRLRRHFGMVPIVLVAVIVESLANLTFVVTTQLLPFIFAQFVLGFSMVLINVNIVTLRQSITPDHLLGRVLSVSRLIAWSLVPLGAIAGTALARLFGAATIIATGSLLSAVIGMLMLLSPIRRLG